MLLEPINKPS